MPTTIRGHKLSGIFFLFSTINLFYLQKKLYLMFSAPLAARWVNFLFTLGVLSSWEPVFSFRGARRLKLFIRYQRQAPLGFFYWYSINLKRGQLVSLRVLRQTLSLRPGVTFLLATSKGLLTSLECFRLGVGGLLIGLLV